MTNPKRTDNAPPHLPWRGIREAAGLTAAALAKKLDLCAATLRRFELGHEGANGVGPLTRARLELLYRDLARETATRRGDAATTPATVAHVAT